MFWVVYIDVYRACIVIWRFIVGENDVSEMVTNGPSAKCDRSIYSILKTHSSPSWLANKLFYKKNWQPKAATIPQRRVVILWIKEMFCYLLLFSPFFTSLYFKLLTKLFGGHIVSLIKHTHKKIDFNKARNEYISNSWLIF